MVVSYLRNSIFAARHAKHCNRQGRPDRYISRVLVVINTVRDGCCPNVFHWTCRFPFVSFFLSVCLCQRKSSPSSADSSSAVREMVWSYGFPLARYVFICQHFYRSIQPRNNAFCSQSFTTFSDIQLGAAYSGRSGRRRTALPLPSVVCANL